MTTPNFDEKLVKSYMDKMVQTESGQDKLKKATFKHNNVMGISKLAERDNEYQSNDKPKSSKIPKLVPGTTKYHSL